MMCVNTRAKLKMVLRAFPVFICILLMSGCFTYVSDDQSKVKPEYLDIANPSIPARMISQIPDNNEKHRVLVAVLSNGVDYTHPLLFKNIHFNQLGFGDIIGTGYDYSGDDLWPSPYLVRVKGSREKVMELVLDNHETRLDSELKSFPKFKNWLHPKRIHSDEARLNIDSGTGMAGVIANGKDTIGLLPYRIIPRVIKKSVSEFKFDYIPEIVEDIIKAIDHARSSGAKIVYFGFSIGNTRPVGNIQAAFVRYLKKKALIKRLEGVITQHSDLLFVVPAANGSGWLDGKTRQVAPCGIKADNLICVASNDDDNRPSQFANIHLGSENIIFAPGEDVKSIVPFRFCKKAFKFVMDGGTQISGEEDMHLTGEQQKKLLKSRVEPVLDYCQLDGRFKFYKGSEFSAALVAGKAADMMARDTQLAPEEVIFRLKKQSKLMLVGDISFLRLPLKKPVWEMPADRLFYGPGYRPWNPDWRGIIDKVLDVEVGE